MLTIVHNVLTKDEVADFRKQLDAAVWQDGAQTARGPARSQKHNQQVDEQSDIAINLGNHILRVLGSNPLFISAALPRKIYPPRFNRYTMGGNYGAHVDAALMTPPGTDITIRSDLSATLFLSDPDEYEGGELEIETPFGLQQVKLSAGDLVLYLASSLHRVTPVTQGARTASFFWVESHIGNDSERALLFDLDQAIQGLTPSVPEDDSHLLTLTGVYHNLLRQWAIT